jgi:hypothetical protein
LKFDTTSKLLIVGVCQILTDPTIYKKCQNIYTIEDETQVLLRHVIILKSNKLTEIEQYYRNYLPRQYLRSNKNIHIIKNKRILKEIEYIEKYKTRSTKTGVFNDLIINYIYEPYLELNIKVIILESIFEINCCFINFPISPPIIYLNNHIFEGPVDDFIENKIYISSELYPKNWNITNRLVNFLGNIINIIIINQKYMKPIVEATFIEHIIKKYNLFINKNELFLE